MKDKLRQIQLYYAYASRFFVLLFIFCIFLFRGKANKKIHNPKKVLVIQLAKIGDMVCTTPMFRAIKRKYPGAKVYVLGNSSNKELLSNNSYVDEYILSRHNLLSTVKRLKKEKIDFACLTSPDFNGLAIPYLSNIKSISAPYIMRGFSPHETKSYKILRNVAILIPHTMGNYAPREYLRLLEPIGIFTDETKKHLSFSDDAEKKVLDFLLREDIDAKSDFIVGVSPSAGNKIKLWGGRKFAELANYIYKNYNAKIIIIGSANDENEINEMVAHLDRNARVINSFKKFNLDELKALISKFSIFISVDTGPIYIAEAFGVPTLDIVGPFDEREQSPMGKFNKVVALENGRNAELHVMNARVYNYKEARRQIDDITVRMVIRKFEELTNLIKEL